VVVLVVIGGWVFFFFFMLKRLGKREIEESRVERKIIIKWYYTRLW